MLRYVLKLMALGLALTPSACHYAITGPRLWADKSDLSFNLWVAMWVVCLLIFAYVFAKVTE